MPRPRDRIRPTRRFVQHPPSLSPLTTRKPQCILATMDIIVCMKLVPDLKQIRIRRDTREPLLDGVPQTWGEVDKNALEEGIRLRDKHGGRVVALALGSGRLREAMVEALAMGADEGVLISDACFWSKDTAATARALATAVTKIGACDLVLTADGSTDNYSGQVAPRLAELLGMPQITYAREILVESGFLRAVRSLEDTFETVECPLPLVVSVTQEINTPRLPALTAILRAARKPVRAWSAADLGLDAIPAVVTRLSNLAPPQERKNILLEGQDAAEKLIAALTREGVLED
jgi:electron transfer flavoprotein beta subunit